MSGALTPRSRNRAKRSTTNLANLRLAPLSSKYVDSPTTNTPPKSPYGESDSSYARSHSSYIQNKSAPSTPGILSRTSSKKRLSGGLSRRESSFYDEDAEEFQYNYGGARPKAGEEPEYGGGQISKTGSEASLTMRQTPRSRHGSSVSQRPGHVGLHRTQTGSREIKQSDESWFTHTSATASALLQESKGQSWLSSRDNTHESTDDDDDENYEEMAALNASTAKLNLEAGEVHSPTSTRISRWGSRYGSRQGSRRASRIASPTGTRTPRAHRRSDSLGYFDTAALESLTQPLDEQPTFASRADRIEEEEDNREVARLTADNSFGLGSVVDRFMAFNLFRADDSGEATEDEDLRRTESSDEARARMAAEAKRKREQKEKLTAVVPPPKQGGGEGKAYVWSDAAWLLSVASKALF